MSDKRKRLWDQYAEYYNNLSTKLEVAGIDVKLLRKVINARSKYDLYDFMDKVMQALKKK